MKEKNRVTWPPLPTSRVPSPSTPHKLLGPFWGNKEATFQSATLSESSNRSPQVRVLKSDSSSRSPQVGVLMSESSSRSSLVLSQSPSFSLKHSVLLVFKILKEMLEWKLGQWFKINVTEVDKVCVLSPFSIWIPLRQREGREYQGMYKHRIIDL